MISINRLKEIGFEAKRRCERSLEEIEERIDRYASQLLDIARVGIFSVSTLIGGLSAGYESKIEDLEFLACAGLVQRKERWTERSLYRKYRLTDKRGKLVDLLSKEKSEAGIRIRPVITISRQIGSGGDQLALNVADHLGFRYVDKSFIVKVAEELKMSETQFAELSEDTYVFRGFIDRLLGRREVTMRHPAPPTKGDKVTFTALDEERYLQSIQKVITEISREGNAVIVGRGGQMILRNHPHAYHVRVIAPLEARVRRLILTLYRGMSPEEVKMFIASGDKAAAQYIRRFYGVDWNDPTLYDLCINTAKLDMDQAAANIISIITKGSSNADTQEGQ